MSDGWGAAPGAGGQQPQDGRQWPVPQPGGPQASAPAGTTPQGLPQRAPSGPAQQPSPFPAHATGQPSGYGYPQQNPYQQGGPYQGYSYPQQGSYQQQPGPYATGPAAVPRNPGEPDWAALAAQNDAAARRKKRLLIIGGGVLGGAAVGGILATALGVFGGKSKDVQTSAGPPASSVSPKHSPSRTTPPPKPVDPLLIIGSAARDTAPLNVRTLFPDVRVSVNGHTYDRDGAPHATGNCAKAGSSGLGEVLAKNQCRAVYRATYTSHGVAVTLGIAVFDDTTHAAGAAARRTGNIYSLYRAIKPFCRSVACTSTEQAIGRYAYFTEGGYMNGKSVPKGDKTVQQAVDDMNTLAHNTLLQRGRLVSARPAG